jgi:hypothetical protein
MGFCRLRMLAPGPPTAASFTLPTRQEPFNLSVIYILRCLMLRCFSPDELGFGHFACNIGEGVGLWDR